MATIILNSSGWSGDDNGGIRITYTASNGTLKITEIEGKRGDGYRSYNANDTAISVSVGGTKKSISLSHYVDFGASGWVKWGATDTSWTGLTGTSIKISTTMQDGTPAYSGYTFSGNATMSWSTYTVSYNANGGSGAPSSQTKTHGTALTLSKTKPTRTGYNFSKWNTKSDGSGTSYASGGSYTSNANVTLYAVWSPYTHTVSYNANGGSGAPASQTKTYGGTIQISSTKPIRTGYTFVNWNTESDGSGTSYASNQTYGYDQNGGTVTLYAIWSENKLTVNLYSNYADYGTYQGAALNVSASSNVLVYSKDYLYDNTYSDGLSNVQNSEYLYLSRSGYTPTGKWGTSTSGGTLLDQTTSYTGQSLAKAVGKDLSNGNASINLYAQWSENILTINYYSNYATTAFDGALNTVGADKNVHVYTSKIYYDNDYSEYGLANYSGSNGSVYMTRTGHTATGNWGTSTSGGILINEDDKSFNTGQAIAVKLGKDISKNSDSINIYAQWRPNVLTVKYHVNGGTVSSDAYYISNNLIYNTSSSFVLEDKWNYNSAHTNGLYNAATFGLVREGYKFIGWKIGSSGTTVFDQDDISIIPTDLASNITTGDQTITLYAVWEISGVVYIDNGTTFEPYLAYIDNGSSWDLYIAYIDDGVNWKIIS